MDGGHVAGLDADRIRHHLGNRRQAVGRAGGVRNDKLIRRDFMVVDTIDDRRIGILAGGRDKYTPGPGGKMCGAGLAVIEPA